MKRIVFFGLLLLSCRQGMRDEGVMFKDDLAFLQKHVDVFVLQSDERSMAVVSPALQGRVLTSTADGPNGLSFGWINRELIASKVNNPHINAYGGEDRFWLGPEGGQFSLFFKPGDPFDLEHWYTPKPVNEEPFEAVERGRDRAVFAKKMSLDNYSNARFDIRLRRTVLMLDRKAAAERFDYSFPEALKQVAFESQNVITNIGDRAWDKETGLVSIWILGMYNPSPTTTVVIPFKPGDESVLGPKVNDAYFGKPPAERLAVKDSVLFFSADGRFRSKIGISPLRARRMLGSYDARHQVLTLVTFNLPEGAVDYVNSMWKIQEQPYAGDVVNSYNDGPAAPGQKPMGPFYELETSSPAAALAPGESLEHVHTTLHLQGDTKALDAVSRALLGVSLKEIETALAK